MKKYRNLLFYTIVITFFSFIIFIVLKKGSILEQGKVIHFIPQLSASNWGQFKETLWHNITEPLSILLLQIITIIIVARIFGFFCKKIGQPSVIGEIIAGIFLGPSFVGMYLPEVSSFLFPHESLGNLQFLSQIGLILFMFVIGMELDLNVLRNKAHDAVVISHSSIIFPFALGITLAYFTYSEFAPANIHFLSFSLFIGISMSITAFPVLARIVQERGLSKTRLGTISITCAAADDITAWCLLAAVIAIVKAGSIISALYTIAAAVTYVFIMVKLVRPFFRKVGEKYSDNESISKPIIALFFTTLLISSYCTEIIGIHALFGAFMAGVIMPSNVNFRGAFIGKVEDVALVLLLPLFFVFTGLRTEIGLLNSPELWKTCAIVTEVAIAGKFIGSSLSAKYVGQSWKDSLSIGALMNTRGLMELVVLNIGYDLGVLSAEIFTMLVIMALLTTFMTGPALDLINKVFKEKKETSSVSKENPKYSILIYFNTPENGVSLLQLSNTLISQSRKNININMLHLFSSNGLNPYHLQEYERNYLMPVEEEARKLNLPITSTLKPSLDIESEISKIANEQNFDLLLVSTENSIFEGSLLGKILGYAAKIINPERFVETISKKDSPFDVFIFDEKINNILKSTKIPVGIYIQKQSRFNHLFIPILSVSDSFLLIYAQKFIKNHNSKVTILDMSGILYQHPEIKETIQHIEKKFPSSISFLEEKGITKSFINTQNLLITSTESWKKLVETKNKWSFKSLSALIIKP